MKDLKHYFIGLSALGLLACVLSGLAYGSTHYPGCTAVVIIFAALTIPIKTMGETIVKEYRIFRQKNGQNLNL